MLSFEAKERRKRGISRDLAWNTAKSALGPWRLSQSPALALPARHLGCRLWLRNEPTPESAEPPHTGSERAVVWKEGSHEAPPYPE